MNRTRRSVDDIPEVETTCTLDLPMVDSFDFQPVADVTDTAGAPLTPSEIAAVKAVTEPKPRSTPAPLFCDFKRNKLPAATIENLKALLKYMRADVKFNLLSRRCEVVIPGVTANADNAESVLLAALNSEAARWELPETSVEKYLLSVADENAYNPFCNFVLSKPWDGVSRFSDLVGCLVTKTPELAYMGLRKTMLGVLAGNFNPSGLGDPPPVLTLTGAQGAGKTTLFRNLIPSEVENGFLEGVTLDPSNKDSVMEATTRALVELGELDATFRKADISKLKAFITRHRDTYREPYGKKDVSRARRSVFVASVNDTKFLVDTTGNRRFLVLEVQDVKLFDGDIQQVWAELYAVWQAGKERHWLTRDETKIIEVHNANYVQHDEVVDLLDSWFVWKDYKPGDKGVYMSATKIALHIDLKPDKNVINRIGAQIRKLHILHKVPEDKRKDRKSCYWVPA